MSNHKQTPISSLRPASFEKNERRGAKGGRETCFICGKALKQQDAQPHYVHLLTDGDITTDTNLNRKDSQGLFPVGSECGKKIKEYLQ